jgi:quaternary ammonium compound-resistance protein SugE
VVSAVLEAVWATALGDTDHFTNAAAIVVFLVALLFSMLGLARAAKSIAIGTAYAVWTGLGAALTVGYAIISGEESVSVMKLVCLTGIIVAVVGLKLLPGSPGVVAPTARVPRRHDQRRYPPRRRPSASTETR